MKTKKAHTKKRGTVTSSLLGVGQYGKYSDAI